MLTNHNQGQELLSLHHISKTFGGTRALADVSLKIKGGNILALLGENGAGKSTLIKILAGVYPKDSGQIVYVHTQINNAQSLQGEDKNAIAFIHQDLGLIDWMTVAENIGFSTGFLPKYGIFIDWKAMQLEAAEVLKVLGVNIDPTERVMNLSRAEQSLVAISRAIAKNSKVIILDEPTASLSITDVERLFSVLRLLRKKGVALVLVSHRLDEIFSICDEVFVLRDGRAVGQYQVSDVDEKQLVKLIVGKEATHRKKRYNKPQSEVILDCQSIVLKGISDPVNLLVHRGEVLALCGLRGAGQEEIGRALFGMAPILSGDILFQGKAYAPSTPYQAISQGIGMLARDRIHESICLNMTVAENIFLNPGSHAHCFWYSLRQERIRVDKQIEKYDIRPKNSNDLEMNVLSGGNQQKTVLARWLLKDIKVLILEDPTQGVDIGARVEIYKHIEAFIADTQVAVVLVSTDFEEIATIADRTLIFSQGRLVQELVGEEVSLNNILYYASGSASEQLN